ncbi:MAG: ferritin-like domain-containing protein [Parvibaculum sp.]|uniref:ferritin-like domain-containing protein n=1 Tax=Parvibaculum sp. TaxID=2024848 RepID=UPI003C76AEB6
MNDVRQITKDQAYDTVAPGDFAAMMDTTRYGQRSGAFDKIISATHDHFWDPLDVRYIDFSEPFDLANEMILSPDMVPELRLPCFEALSEKDKVRFANETARWFLSSILHGEQGALNLSASLCHILRDPGAQEYAANQAREEARHVTAFARYVKARWGKPLPVGTTLSGLLSEMVHAQEVYKKIVGMQLLVEGLAMGTFASLYNHSRDPLLVKLCQLAMTDEAFHHKFGKIWADRTIPKLAQDERDLIEDWAASCFQTLLFNLVNPEQKQALYAQFGLDWKQVQAEMLEAVTDADRREQMKDATNVFRVLVKTLLKAGIITSRTKAFYAVYVDMDELHDEDDRMVGDDIAEQGIEFLKTVNFAKKSPLQVTAAE